MTRPDSSDRAARVEEIRAGAITRRHLGQAAICRRSGGRWCVTFRGKMYESDDLQAAIRLALGRGRMPQG